MGLKLTQGGYRPPGKSPADGPANCRHNDSTASNSCLAFASNRYPKVPNGDLSVQTTFPRLLLDHTAQRPAAPAETAVFVRLQPGNKAWADSRYYKNPEAAAEVLTPDDGRRERRRDVRAQVRREDAQVFPHIKEAVAFGDKRERGEMTRGSIELRGERTEKLNTSEMVHRGVIQVMEGRHCFAHLTIKDNLMTGTYTRKDGKAVVVATLEKVYTYFPRLKTRRTSQAAYTSGSEQQMCSIGRATIASPTMAPLDEPSMGLAPQIVKELFEIVKDLNQREKVTFLLAEQNTNMALRYADYGYILESGRIVMDGPAASLRENEHVKEFYIGMGGGDRKSFKDGKGYKRRKCWLS